MDLSNKNKLKFDKDFKACWSLSTQCLGSVALLAKFYHHLINLLSQETQDAHISMVLKSKG